VDKFAPGRDVRELTFATDLMDAIPRPPLFGFGSLVSDVVPDFRRSGFSILRSRKHRFQRFRIGGRHTADARHNPGYDPCLRRSGKSGNVSAPLALAPCYPRRYPHGDFGLDVTAEGLEVVTENPFWDLDRSLFR
jgi:hypothetical protein